MLNQEPGYVIYSAVGSFYAPMLVMMFFNWKIYRTATKTTKAIRQGWTRVKGVSGDEEIGLGIHRGGGASNRIRANGSSRYEKRYEMETGVKAIQMFKYNGRWRHEKRSFLTA